MTGGTVAAVLFAAVVGLCVGMLAMRPWTRPTSSRSALEAERDHLHTLLARRDVETARLSELSQALIDAVPRPVLITDQDRIIRLANRAALELAHLPSEQVVGRVAATVIQDYDTMRLLLESVETGQPQERTFHRPTTGQTWHVGVTPLNLAQQDNGGQHEMQGVTDVILTIEDLTELRRLETIRRDFVAHVSHELRTPLAAMRLLAETLVGALDYDLEAARDFAQRITGEIDHLTQMVSELLELSRIESGKITLRREPTDIAGLIEVVLDRTMPLAIERDISLRADVPDGLPDADADASRVSEVLINLIHNGLKYTASGGTLTVSASLAMPPADDLCAQPGWACTLPASGPQFPSTTPLLVLRVRDTGIGITEDDLPRVFERFFKVDRARTRSVGTTGYERGDETGGEVVASAAAGTGLGLAIAKHLVELHGGHIWAESRPRQGSVFSFSLPVVPVENDLTTEHNTEPLVAQADGHES